MDSSCHATLLNNWRSDQMKAMFSKTNSASFSSLKIGIILTALLLIPLCEQQQAQQTRPYPTKCVPTCCAWIFFLIDSTFFKVFPHPFLPASLSLDHMSSLDLKVLVLTWPNHLEQASLISCSSGATTNFYRTDSFLIVSFLVHHHIPHSILISITFIWCKRWCSIAQLHALNNCWSESFRSL